jgi:hypothetical protein
MRNLLQKKSLLAIFLIIIVVIIIIFAYHLPVEKVKNMTVCTLDGQLADIKIDIKFYKSFFKPTIGKGTIIFNGVEYINATEKGFEPFYKDSLFTKLELKSNGLPYLYFVNSSLNPPSYLSDTILFTKVNDMDEVAFMYTKADNETGGIEYFGPAATSEEAYNIYKLLYKK